MILLALLAACGLTEGRTTLTLTLRAAEGYPDPTGAASLTRLETQGDWDGDGTQLVPSVAGRDHGSISFGDEVVLRVPDGHILYSIEGFDPTGRCEEQVDTASECWGGVWTGQASVHVGDTYNPGLYDSPVDNLATGASGEIVVEVYEGCTCTG